MNVRHAVLAIALCGALALVMFGGASKSGANDGAMVDVVESVAPSKLKSRPMPAVAHPPVRAVAVAGEMSLPADVVRGHVDARIGALVTRDLFAAKSFEAPAKPVKALPPVVEVPVAPPLNFTVLGKQHDGARWTVFLGRGEQVWVVQEGSLLDGNYRVEAIKPPQMSLIYQPLSVAQHLNIGSGE